MTGKYINWQECERIARKIWRGKFPRNHGVKFAGSLEMGVDYINDYCVVKSNWTLVTDTLEMKLEKGCFNDGRFYVRKAKVN